MTALYAADEETTEPEKGFPTHLSLIVFGGSFLVFAAFAWRPVFWVDEYLTQAAISRPWAGLLHHIATADPAPGPYYLVMKIWSTVSVDPFWMRLPSILAMACAVVVLTRLVHRIAGPGTACLTAAVLLVMPNVSRFAQENRPYAFAVLGTVAAVALWHRSVDGARPRASVGYAAAVAGMGLAHLYTLTLIPALVVAAVARPAGQRAAAFWRTVVPAAVAVLVISPHIYLNLANPTGSPTDPPLSISSVAGLVSASLPNGLAAGLAVPAVLGLLVSLRRPAMRPLAILALAWTVIPSVLLLSAKLAVDLPLTRPRYVVFLMPGLAVLVALGLRRLAGLHRALAVTVLTALAILGLPRQIDIRSIDGHNRDQALAPLLREANQLGIPIVPANNSAVRLINAATYPQTLLSGPVDPATAEYVTVVERTRFANTVPRDFPYYQADGPWRPILRCRVSEALVLLFENKNLPTRTPDPSAEFGTRFEQSTNGRVKCRAVTGLVR